MIFTSLLALTVEANSSKNRLEPSVLDTGEILYSIQIFFLYSDPWPKYLHPQPIWKEPTAACNSAAQQPAASTHAARARTLAGRPIARSRLADASTASFAHRFDCTPPIPAPAAFSAVRHSTFSASPNLTIAAGRRKQQGAPASGQRPAASTAAPRQPPGAQQAAAYSAVSTPLSSSCPSFHRVSNFKYSSLFQSFSFHQFDHPMILIL